MEKKFDDDEWKKFLEEEYIKEADLMEEALFSDEDFPDMEMTDEEVDASFDRLMDRLKADGVYREEPKEETPKEEEAKVVELKSARKKKKTRQLVTRHKLAKIAGFVVMCTLTVFAASMTSEANRNYFISSMNYLMGNDTQIIIGNVEENEDPKMDEFNAKEEIEDKLGVAMPDFLYYPESLVFKAYKISELNKYAYLEYIYKKNIIAFFIKQYDENDKSMNLNLHGNKIGVTSIENSDIIVSLFEVKDKQDIMESYAAQWNYNGFFYQISGKMERNEFEKMIQKIIFYE